MGQASERLLPSPPLQPSSDSASLRLSYIEKGETPFLLRIHSPGSSGRPDLHQAGRVCVVVPAYGHHIPLPPGAISLGRGRVPLSASHETPPCAQAPALIMVWLMNRRSRGAGMGVRLLEKNQINRSPFIPRTHRANPQPGCHAVRWLHSLPVAR